MGNDAYHDTVPLSINSSEDIQPCAVNSSSFVNRSVSTSEGSSVTHDEECHEEIDPALSQKRNDAISTLPTSADFVDSMLDFDDYNDAYHNTVPLSINSSEDIQPCAVNSSSFVNRSVSTSEGSSVTHDEERHEGISPALSQKLNDAISTLPKSLQNIFVERIVENIANPDAYKKHMEAVSVLATAAAIEAQNKVSEEGDDNNLSTETTLPVAAAALGAYLAKYEEATSKGCPA